MRLFTLRFLAAGLAVLLAYPVLAQQGPGGGRGKGGFGFGGPGGDPSMLILNKSVQDELKLTDDQKSDLHKVQEKLTAAGQKARESGDREKGQEVMKAAHEETKKDLDKWKEASLKPEQTKRLKQIELQNGGLRAFADADVQKSLNLTDKQKDEIKDISESTNKDVQELRASAQGDRQKFREVRTKVEAIQKEAKEKVSGLLTEDQKKTWKEMVGEPFEVKFERPQGGRRQGGNQGGNQSQSKSE
jgi:Spy/CpxP family protein refolding chaperone